MIERGIEMSIKLMDGKRVVDFRIQETRVKEEVFSLVFLLPFTVIIYT